MHIAAAVAEPGALVSPLESMDESDGLRAFNSLHWLRMFIHVGLSENGGTPKWMVYTGKFYSMDDLGGPNFRKETSMFIAAIADKP